MSKRNEYIANMKQQLDELDAEIARLEAKTQEAKGKAREKYEATLDNIRQEGQLVQDKLEAVKAAGEDEWETISAEVDNVWNAFKRSVEFFKLQL